MTSPLQKRVERLEKSEGPEGGRAFLWFPNVPLADALASAGLSLADKPLMAIEIKGVLSNRDGPLVVPDPVHERDRHLLD